MTEGREELLAEETGARDPLRTLLEPALAEFGSELAAEAARLHRAAFKYLSDTVRAPGGFEFVQVYGPGQKART